MKTVATSVGIILFAIALASFNSISTILSLLADTQNTQIILNCLQLTEKDISLSLCDKYLIN